MTLKANLSPAAAVCSKICSTSPSNSCELKAWHPWLFALVPVVSLAAGCFYELQWTDLLWPLAAVFVLAGLAYVTFRCLNFSPARASIGVSCLLILFFAYRFLRDSLQVAAFQAADFWLPAWIVLVVWGAVAVGGLAWIRAGRLNELGLNRLLNTVAIMLLLVISGRLLFDLASYSFLFSQPTASAEHIEQERATQSALEAHAARGRQAHSAPARDIYYLVFDRYGSQRTLAAEFDFDNEPFLAELRSRGFIVADDSRANYAQTLLSMSAALNLGFHNRDIASHGHYADQIAEHRLGRWLKGRGYTLGHFGNWHQPFRNAPQADVVSCSGLLPSEFSEALCASTPLSEILPLPGAPQPILQQFSSVERFAAHTAKPKFAYAHFLLPHPPFVFDADGAPLANNVACRRTFAENYRNQLQFTNRRLLQLIDRIQASSATPPIIIVQADEGPYLQPHDQHLDPSRKLAKRFGILSAFCLPGLPGEASVVPSDITPVNTFRLVLREYFGVPLPPLPDRSFYWNSPTPEGSLNWRSPGRFFDVSGELSSSVLLLPGGGENSVGD